MAEEADMLKRIFGNSGVLVPVIGQGSWQFPSAAKAIEEAKTSLRIGIEHGMVHIDTAEMYGDSELIIADAIKDLPREELFVVSKVLPSNASARGTIKACEKSLKRLGLDYLDCYLLHWRGSIALSETMSAFESLLDQGKIRSLGVSNFDQDDLQEAVDCLSKHKIACNQVLYNLFERGIERKVIPFCEKKNIAVVGYTPFAQRGVPSGDGGMVLEKIAAEHNASPRQIMLAFLVRKDILFTIPKAAKQNHTIENAESGKIKLSADEISQIDAAFPAPKKDTPLAMI